MRGVFHRGHWGSHGIIRGVSSSLAGVSVCRADPKLWSKALHSPCWTISPLHPCPAVTPSALEMGAVPGGAQQGEQCQTHGASTPGSWLCPWQAENGAALCRNLAKLSTNQCPEDAKPAWLLAPWGFSCF